MRPGLVHPAVQIPAGRVAGRAERGPTPRCVAESRVSTRIFPAPRPTPPAFDGASGTDRRERGAAVERANRNPLLPAHHDVGRRGAALSARLRARLVVRAGQPQQREPPPESPRRVGGLEGRVAGVAPLTPILFT